MPRFLGGWKRKISVNDVLLREQSGTTVETLDELLTCLESVGLFASAHEHSFVAPYISWCTPVYSLGQVSHDSQRFQGLATVHRPRTAGKMIKSLQATKVMRASLPRMAEIVDPLRAMLEERMHGSPRRTAKVTRNQIFPESACTDDRVQAWKAVQDLVAHAVTLHHPRSDLEVFIFPDASNTHRGTSLARVSRSKYHSGKLKGPQMNRGSR